MRPGEPNIDRLLGDLEHLGSFGAREDGGLNRPAFSPPFVEASRWLADRMSDAGLAARIDAAGNVIGRLGPARGPALICGSHIDTVPGGGAYDGALGVIAGLECARTLAEEACPLQVALEVVAFSDEEGAYLSMLGSRAMTGHLSSTEVDGARGRQGESLVDAMHRAGLKAASLDQAFRPREDFAYYLELHIEQGPVLVGKDLDIGIVDSIVATDTVEYVLHGEARHAGTTPMDARRDAGRAACEAVASAFHGGLHRVSPECRMTFGAMELSPSASNVVPGLSRTVSEVRAARSQELRQIRHAVDAAFEQAAALHALHLQSRHLGTDPASHMSAEMIDLIASACTDLDRKFTVLPSGAGHDASSFARLVPTGMIFVASRDGISHHPDEYSDDAAIAAGTDVMLQVVRKLVQGGTPWSGVAVRER